MTTWAPGQGRGGIDTPGVPMTLLVQAQLTDGHCSRHPFVVLSQRQAGGKWGGMGYPEIKSFYELPDLAERGIWPTGTDDEQSLLYLVPSVRVKLFLV